MPRFDYWNVAFMLFFVLLAIVGYALVGMYGRSPRFINWWDALLVALAVMRLTRLVVYDAITKWFRDLVEFAEPLSFLGTVKTLVNCPWCVGLWFALIVSTVYFAWPELWFFIFILAVGAVASIMQVGANSIGWSAEQKKRATLKEGEQDFANKCG